MFAGCIEKKHSADGLGLILIDQMDTGVLSQFPSQNKSHWQGEFDNDCLVTLVQQSIHSDQCSSVACHGDVYIAGWLRIDNKDELREQLDLTQDVTDHQIVIAAYCLWREQLCEYLFGDFAFVLIDLKEHQCLLCRDHMGVRPLYYYQDDSRFIFATTIAVFSNIKGLNLQFSEEYIARHCMFMANDWELTAYEQILKLPPAHTAKLYVSVNKSQDQSVFKLGLDIQSYFSFDQNKRLSLNTEHDYIERYKEVLDEAVRCRVAGVEGVLASESSGGVDSSTVTGFAAKYLPLPEDNLYAYGFVTEVEEEACISLMSEHLKLKHTYLVKGGVNEADLMQQAAKRFQNIIATPISAPIATVHSPIYHQAKADGATILLSGFGGDEFVTVYGATARVELFKQRQWKAWFTLFKGNFLTKKMRAFKWLLRFYWNQNTFETAQHLLGMNSLLLKNKVIKDNVCEQYKIPQRSTQRSSYDAGCLSINEFSLVNRWSPDMVARLEDCSLAAALHGLEYRWPLLDVRLISFFLSIPSQYKLSNGLPRYLHRKAIQGIVPEHLIWKDKSMGGPLISQSSQSRMPEKNEILDIEEMQFSTLHPKIQAVIDEEKWIAILAQLSDSNTELIDSGNDNSFNKIWPIAEPVMSLNEWLNSVEKV